MSWTFSPKYENIGSQLAKGWHAATTLPREAHRATSKDVRSTVHSSTKSNPGLRKCTSEDHLSPQLVPRHEGNLVPKQGENTFFGTWGMHFNADKSEWLQITSKHTAAQDDNRLWITMRGQAIPRVKAHNHLGLKVTGTLSSGSEHISRTRAKWIRPASGYNQEDPSSPKPRFEKDLCSSSSFRFGIRVCGLERR